MILRWISVYWIDLFGVAMYLAAMPFLISVAIDAWRVWKHGGGRMAWGLMVSRVTEILLFTYLILIVWVRYDLAPIANVVKGELALFIRPMALLSAMAIWWALRTEKK